MDNDLLSDAAKAPQTGDTSKSDAVDAMPATRRSQFQKRFEIASICRDDLYEIGFNVDDVSDDTMSLLASRLFDEYYCEQFFSSLATIAEVLRIPREPQPA